jgi:hypothetical protein
MSCYYKFPRRGKDGCDTANLQYGGSCQEKLEGCKTDIEYYHWLCDKYWDMDPQQIEGMTESEMDKAIMQLDLCVVLRDKHNEKCVHPRCRDRGHIGAIEKLKKKIEYIKTKRYGKRVGLIYRSIIDTDLDERQIEKLLEDIIKEELPVDNIPFPKLPAKLNYKKFLDSIAHELGTSVVVEKVGDLSWIMVGILLPSSRMIVEIEESGDANIGYKKLADTMVDMFATSTYRDAYLKRSK